MMWNYLVSGLGVGATVVMFDGNPAHPDLRMLWRMAGELRLTYFGTSAPFLLSCRKEGVVPKEVADLSALRGIGSTGAPLPVEGFRWVYDAVADGLQLGSLSGGTDVCSGFVGSAPTVPVYAGEIACRCLGAAVAAYDADGRAGVGSLGELVIERPMPSMPVGLLERPGRRRATARPTTRTSRGCGGTATGSRSPSAAPARSPAAATPPSTAAASGWGPRSSTPWWRRSTRCVDSLVVHLEDAEGGAGTLVLFVQLAGGVVLDDEVRRAIATALRTRLSPGTSPTWCSGCRSSRTRCRASGSRCR